MSRLAASCMARNYIDSRKDQKPTQQIGLRVTSLKPVLAVPIPLLQSLLQFLATTLALLTQAESLA